MEKIRLGMYKTRISPKVSDIRNGGTKYLLFGCFEGVVFLKAYMDEDSYILGTWNLGEYLLLLEFFAHQHYFTNKLRYLQLEIPSPWNTLRAGRLEQFCGPRPRKLRYCLFMVGKQFQLYSYQMMILVASSMVERTQKKNFYIFYSKKASRQRFLSTYQLWDISPLNITRNRCKTQPSISTLWRLMC